MTNFESIYPLTKDEFADFLDENDVLVTEWCPKDAERYYECDHDCKKCIMKWLDKETTV